MSGSCKEGAGVDEEEKKEASRAVARAARAAARASCACDDGLCGITLSVTVSMHGARTGTQQIDISNLLRVDHASSRIDDEIFPSSLSPPPLSFFFPLFSVSP